uniref:Arrestin C-terminal-like domain-containing protein n=1 Tax=Acrobeloides nanus TaxID=290746 RepID=A0A914EI11_9BILA
MTADAVFERFDIEFDAGNDPVFHGGELITGSLKVNLKQQVTIKAIRLQFKGRASWLGDTAKGAEVEKVYFDKDFVLLERPPGHPEPGHFPWIANFTYSLPFECPLPKGCPTSYEGPQAFIRYFARATFQTDEVDSKQYMVKKGFTIVSPPELHQLLPPQSDPVSVKETVTFGGCCCRGKVTAEVSLPKTTYAPGENVIGNFTVDNRYSRSILDQVEVRLVDRVNRASTDIEHSGKPVVNHRAILQKKLETNDVIKSKQTVTREDVTFLTIPPVCPSTGDPITAQSSPENVPFIRDGKASAILESPSTATLKFRKQPFVKINYAIQVSLGNRVLIEVPITIHPIPIYASGIEFRPFAAGAQPIGESDETDKKLVNGPFKFEPLYPTYVVAPPPPPKPIKIQDEVEVKTQDEVAPIPNGNVELTRKLEISELPDGDHAILTKEEIFIVREVDHRIEKVPELEHHPIEKQPELRRESPPEIEHEHQPEAELEEQPIEEHQPEPQPEPSIVISRAPEVDENEEESGSVVIHEENGHHELNGDHEPHVEREVQDYDLANGHVHTVTETIEDGPIKTQKKVETYEYTDENGVHVEVTHRTEETTHISSTDGITIENGGTPQTAE